MEVLIVIWVLAGIVHFVYDWILGEYSLNKFKHLMTPFEFVLNFVFQLLLVVLGGPVWLAYTLYKAWKDNQPFTP
jgi:hypothetical protein